MTRDDEPVRISRRAFLVGLELSLGGLALGIFPSLRPSLVSADPTPAKDDELAGGWWPNVFIHVAEDSTVTIVCARSEMGQGVRSAIPMLVADELGVDPAKVVVRQAVGDKKYGDQNTDGSSSIRKGYDNLRKAGAAARMMLVQAAAARWKVPAAQCTTQNGEIIHGPSNKKLPFGAVVAAAAKLPVPKAPVLRDGKELVHVARADTPLLDGEDIVRGKASYGADVRLADMLIAVIARPPVVGGKLLRHDDAAALKVPGVKRIVVMPEPKLPYKFQPWGGVAVVATSTWAAIKGRAALQLEWDHGDNASYDSTDFRNEMLASVRSPGTPVRTVGDVDTAFGKAARTLEAEYTCPHLGHIPMEPPAAVAKVANGKAEVWCCTQNPQAAREEVARVLQLDEANVTINVTLLGGAFGRKSKADFPSEAAFLAKEMGVPVRVQFTREDDLRHDYVNAANAQLLRAALDDKGKIIGWHHRTALTPITSTFVAGADTATADDLQQGVLDLALDIPNIRAEACKAAVHTRVGWFRSVYNIFHAFASGSFIDELAHLRGVDPRDMWLEVIGPARQLSTTDLGIAALKNYGEPLTKHPVDAGRLRGVLERVTDAAQWSTRKQRGKFLGLAAHRSFVSYVAAVISVVPDPKHVIRVDEAWICMDAGTVVDRDRVHSQLEGAVVMGISNVLFGGITMKHGSVEQSNFREARIARMNNVPAHIHTDIVPSTAPPGGVGEPGVPPVGAALANAVFALTGKRIRDVPLAAALKA